VNQSNRLVFNTLVTFGRMGLTFGVGLAATRVLLDALGHVDFGLVAALGASGTLVVFLGYSLSSAAVRYLAHEIGRADDERLIEVFNASLVLFGMLGAGMLAVGVALQPVLLSALNIPPERLDAAWWVYLLTLLNLVLTTVNTPFGSVVAARQAMGQLALFDAIRTVLSLVAALLLLVVDGDLMVHYAAFVLAAGVLRVLAMVVVSMWRFPESRPHLSRFHFRELSRVSSFAGWAIVANLGRQIAHQAAIVMLGIAYTPVVSAAYAIAMRVGGYHNNFSNVVPHVVQPAMATLEARGNRRDVQDMALMAGKYGTIGVLFLVVPLLIETQGILRVWLVDVPPWAALFVQLTLVWHTLMVLTSGFDKAVYAHGNIRAYALLTSAVWALSLLLGALLIFGLGLAPWVLPACLLGAAMAQVPVRIRIAGDPIELGYGRWLRETIWPVAMPTLGGLLAASVVHVGMADGWLRYACVTAAFAAAAAPITWAVTVGPRENDVLRGMLSSRLSRAGATS
jgi:O-antigen/teichoic acid export membrane protein